MGLNKKNMSNNMKTELDFNERNDPEVTKSFIIDLLFLVTIVIACVIGIVWVLLNSEMIDKIKPEVQLIIFAVACFVFGIIRTVIWIRKMF